MREIERTNQFHKDYKLALKRGRKLSRMPEAIVLLANDEALPARFRVHKLVGDMAGYWECHLEPDYLMVYEYAEDALVLVRLGTHADLF